MINSKKYLFLLMVMLSMIMTGHNLIPMLSQTLHLIKSRFWLVINFQGFNFVKLLRNRWWITANSLKNPLFRGDFHIYISLVSSVRDILKINCWSMIG